MPLSKQKISLHQMFSRSDVTEARVRAILELEDLKARIALARLYSELSDAKEKGQDVESLLSLVGIFYTPAAKALGDRLSALGYTEAELSAALMVGDGVIVLE